MLCRLSRFLFKQHTTPHATVGKSPAELMFGRPLSTPLDRLNPLTFGAPGEEETRQTDNAAGFDKGEPVFIRNFSGSPKWVEGFVQRQLGRRSYEIVTDDGAQRRHVDHIRRRQVSETQDSTTNTALGDWLVLQDNPTPSLVRDQIEAGTVEAMPPPPPSAELCEPRTTRGRLCKKPSYLRDYVT